MLISAHNVSVNASRRSRAAARWATKNSRSRTVGYRVSVKGSSFFYVPDVAWLPDATKALGGIDVYIGDGATIKRSMVRRRGRTLIGHAPIVAQLGWCLKTGVGQAIFTHCGSQIVRGDARRLDALVRRLGREYGIEAHLACDGDRLPFPMPAASLD